MTEHKFTDEEVIKALEHYKGFRLYPFSNHEKGDDIILVDDALDLINRQSEDIDRLIEINTHNIVSQNEIKAEAVKEFAEGVKEKMQDLARLDYGGNVLFLVSEKFIDNLVKEFTEGKKECPNCKHFVGCETACGGVPCGEYCAPEKLFNYH